MTQVISEYQRATLKAATYRLTSTSVHQLPSIVPTICAQLVSCRDILSLDEAASSRTGPDTATYVHKLKTRISALLQDRSSEGRWAGTVLAKTTIECGGHVVLQDCLPWIRGLLASLNKSDPVVTKRLMIIALTRLFFLTRDYPTLVREITTPNLPTFVASCCQLLSSRPQLAQTIFESFSQLIGRHPTIFRSFVKQLRPILLQYIAPVSLEPFGSDSAQQASRRLFVQLHETAPKNAASSEWETGFKHAIDCTHEVVDQVLRSVLEDWESTVGYHPIQHSLQALSAEPAQLEIDALGLHGWKGLHQGLRRISGLLQLIRAYIITPTSFAPSVNIGALVDLLRRILSTCRPVNPREWETTGRADSRFDRKEREELALDLPTLHVGAAQVVETLIRRLGNSSMAIDADLLDQLTWVLETEKSEVALRTSMYPAIEAILSSIGTGVNKRIVESLNGVIKTCCADLMPTTSPSKPHLDQVTNNALNGVGHKPSISSSSTQLVQQDPALRSAAASLLPTLLGLLRSEVLPRSMRAEMDRVAMLTQNKAALLASIQNASENHQSLLPLVARIFPNDSDVQGFLKPRMPVVMHSVARAEDDRDLEEESSRDEDTSLHEHNDQDEGGFEAEQFHQVRAKALPNAFTPSKPNVNHLFPVDYQQNNVNGEVRSSVLDSAQKDAHDKNAGAAPDEALSTKRRRSEDVQEGGVDKRTRATDWSGSASQTSTSLPPAPPDVNWTVQEPTVITPKSTVTGATAMRAGQHNSDTLYLPQNAAEATASSTGADKDMSSDSDDEDFEIPQLHFRSASDDEEDDGGDGEEDGR